MAENWNNQLEYLQKSRILAHNDDYIEFLVKKVWKLNKICKVADFGCGFGYMGTKLMPLLRKGSIYTGIDKATVLLKAARKLFADTSYPHRFVRSEVYKTPFPDASFDLTVSHAVLMHLERPVEALKEMIRVTRPGGLVVAADANRNAWYALFHLEEFNTQETVPLTFPQQLNKSIRLKTGVDYNIGIKTPVMMEKAGLINIGCRMDDRITYLSPALDEPEKEVLFEALCQSGFALPDNYEDERVGKRKYLLEHGVHPEDIDNIFASEVAWDFKNKGKTYHTLYPEVLTWAYGTVKK